MPTADQLIDLIRPDFDALNELLISQLGSEIDFIEEVSQYLIQSGGKRVRPLVTLMAARALNTDNQHHIPLAASIECLAYTDTRYNEADFKVTNQLSDEVISLPMHTELDQEQIDFITTTILEFLDN